MDNDYLDYVGYKIFIGEGKDVGWPTDYYFEDEEEEEPESIDLGEMIQRALKPLANLSEEWERIDRDGTRENRT